MASLKKFARSLVTPFFQGSGLRLFDGAYPTDEQKSRPMIPGDTRRALIRQVWRNLLGISRYLYSNVGTLRSAVRDKATLATVDGWQFQYYGEDKQWRKESEKWVYDWLKICDIRGKPFNFWQDLFICSIAQDRDGDYGIVPVDSDGYPFIQFIPSHLIDARRGERIVTDGTYKDLRIENGVIFNGARAVAYRVTASDESWGDYEDISAQTMGFFFEPEWFDQARGYSSFAHGILDVMNFQDIRELLMIQVKNDSSEGFIEYNADGEVDTGQGHFSEKTGPTGQKMVVERMNGVENRYYKSTDGSKLDYINTERPSPNVPAFLSDIVRGVFGGMGSSAELYDSRESGGASLRVVVDKIMKYISMRQCNLEDTARFIVTYGISKAAKSKILRKPPVDWLNFGFTKPARLTPDAGKEAEMDREGIKLGTTTYREVYGKRGMDGNDQLRQKAMEARLIKDLAQEFGVEESSIRMLDPNGLAATGQDPKQNTGAK